MPLQQNNMLTHRHPSQPLTLEQPGSRGNKIGVKPPKGSSSGIVGE